MAEPEFEVAGVYNCIKRSDFFSEEEKQQFQNPQYLATQVIPEKTKRLYSFCMFIRYTHL